MTNQCKSLEERAQAAADAHIIKWLEGKHIFYNGQTLEMKNNFIPGYIVGATAAQQSCEDIIGKMEEVIKFYGDPKHWLETQKMNFSYHDELDSKHNDMETIDDETILISGKRARALLAELALWRKNEGKL